VKTDTADIRQELSYRQ